MRSLARLLEVIHRGEDIDRWQAYEFCKAVGETHLLAGVSEGRFIEAMQRALVYHGGALWFRRNYERFWEGVREYLDSDWPAIHEVRREEAHAS